MICGCYDLAEWHSAGIALAPPQVSGRFIVLDGTITSILYMRPSTGPRVTSVLVGRYRLEQTRFAYGYHEASIFTETPSAVSVSRTPPWEGLRYFDVLRATGAVELLSDNRQWQFEFTPAGLEYSENGRRLRVWRRV